MEAVIKAYVGLFFVGLSLVISLSLVEASMNQRIANSTANSFATRIEAAGLAEGEIDNCKNKAQELGYGLDVSVFESEERKLGELSFTYQYRVPVLSINTEKEIIVPLR